MRGAAVRPPAVWTKRAHLRDEQNRQSFAPPAPITLRDPRLDILEPFARLARPCADAVTDTVHACFFDHGAPLMLSFGPLIDTLTAQPRPAPQPQPQPDLDDELVEVDPVFRQFDDDAWDASDKILEVVGEQPVRLSQLLDACPEQRQVALLTALRCLRVFDADGQRHPTRATSSGADGLVAADDGAELDSPWLLAPDLLIWRPGTSEATP